MIAIHIYFTDTSHEQEKAILNRVRVPGALAGCIHRHGALLLTLMNGRWQRMDDRHPHIFHRHEQEKAVRVSLK